MHVTDIPHYMKVFFLGLDPGLYTDRKRQRPEFDTEIFVDQLNHQLVSNDLFAAPRNLND